MRKIGYENTITGEKTYSYNIAREWKEYKTFFEDFHLEVNEKIEKAKAKEKHRKKIAGVD